MKRFGDIGRQALSRHRRAAQSIREGVGEFVLWRHLDRSSRRPQSDNAMGMDPDGADFEGTDYAAWAVRNPEEGETRFYMEVSPDRGDYIFTLQGHPQNEDDALDAGIVGAFCVVDTLPYRSPAGKASHMEVITEPDHSRRFKK